MAEPTTMIAASAGALIAKEAFKPLIHDIYSFVKKKSSQAFKKSQFAGAMENMYLHSMQVRNVKTLWQIDRVVDITDFYYPARIDVEGGETQQIENASELPIRTILRGTVGQGKSILMRYLTYQDLMIGERLPIFLELRRLNSEDSLRSHLTDFVKGLGFPSGADSLEAILLSQKAALFLDGFDEVHDSKKMRVFDSVEKIAKQYPGTRIIISTRPGTEILTSTHFQIRDVAKLSAHDVPVVIQKLMSSKGDPSPLLKELAATSKSVVDLLDTPLMVTLLLISYSRNSRIPSKFSEFFESLFITLLSRHDESKPGGFKRDRKCDLTDSSIQKVFDSLAFVTKNAGSIEFKRSKMLALTEKVVKQPGCECRPDEFLDDMNAITCLILREGNYYRYIHKSVQEYHAASYVSRLGDDKACKFYSKVGSDSLWIRWQESLEFLSEIDRHRFLKFFLIPNTESFLESVFLKIPKSTKPNISKAAARRLLASEVDGNHLIITDPGATYHTPACGRTSFIAKGPHWVFDLIDSLPVEANQMPEREVDSWLDDDDSLLIDLCDLIDDAECWIIVKQHIGEFMHSIMNQYCDHLAYVKDYEDSENLIIDL